MGELKPVEVAVKSGAKTSEFWLSVVASICGFILASNSLAEGSTAALVVGGLMIILAALGYTKGRTSVKVAEETRKAEESKAAGLLAMAREKIEELKAGRDKAKADAALLAAKVDTTPGAIVAGDQPSARMEPVPEGA